MITFALYVLLGLFALKILWNLTLPYKMAAMLSKCAGQRTSTVTFMTFVEIVLLLLAIGTAALSDGKNWLHSPKNIAVWGGVAIVISYVHLVIMGMILGWIISSLKKRRKSEQ